MRQRCLICAYDSAPILERLIPLLGQLCEYYEPVVFVQFPATQRRLEKLGYETFLYRAVIGWEHGNLKPLNQLANAKPHQSYESSLYGAHYDWKRYEDELRTKIGKVFLALQPHLLIAWNGLTLPMTQFVATAKANDVPIRYLERGLFPGTIFVDSLGTNAASSIATQEHFDCQLVSLGKLICEIFQKRYKPIVKQESESQTLPKWEQSPTRAVFIEQLDHDTNIVLFANSYPSNQVAIETFKTSLNLSDSAIVVKSHPEAAPKALSTDRNQRTRAGLQELFQKSDLILTRNSSVGFEALIHNKSVYTLGASFYQRFCQSELGTSTQSENATSEQFYAFVGELFSKHHIITDPNVAQDYPKSQGLDTLLIKVSKARPQDANQTSKPYWRRSVVKYFQRLQWSLRLSTRSFRKRVTRD